MQLLADIQRKFFYSLGKNFVPMTALVTSCIIHVIASYFLVVKMELGIVGTGISSSIAAGTALTIQLVYAYFLPDIREAVQLPRRSAFIDLCKYLEIGIPLRSWRRVTRFATTF